MGKSTVAMPDIPEEWKDNSSDTKAEVGQYYLPGVGPTYLHPEFADKVGDFIQKAKDQGISLQFTSGYRDQAKQADLRDATLVSAALPRCPCGAARSLPAS